MISIRKQRCLLHLHDTFGWRKVLCTVFLIQGRQMEHGVSVGCLLQSYFNVSWESKLLLFQFPEPLRSHWGRLRAVPDIRARLVSAIRGCFLLGLVHSASWKKSKSSVWPCTADIQQIFQGCKIPWSCRKIKSLSLSLMWSSSMSAFHRQQSEEPLYLLKCKSFVLK